MSVDPFAEMVIGSPAGLGSAADATYRASESWQQTIRDQWRASDVLLIAELDRRRFAPATERALISGFVEVDGEGPLAIWRRRG